jgi:hypothetical protein
MSIKITVKQLIDAATSGALGRYFALEKPIAATWKNRKQVEACNTELKAYDEKRIELCKKHGRLAENNIYLFTGDGLDEKAQANFDAEILELWKQDVDSIPGEPVKIQTITGSLKETDAVLLEPFLTE